MKKTINTFFNITSSKLAPLSFIIICCMTFTIVIEVTGQAVIQDTIVESPNYISMQVSNDYYSWTEKNDTEHRIFLGTGNTFSSKIFPSSYSSCRRDGLTIYNDLVYYSFHHLINPPECNNGFTWELGQDLVIDQLDIGDVEAEYENLIINSEDELVDILTGNKQQLAFESADHTFNFSNILTLNDKYIYVKVFRENKVTNVFDGQGIIKYNRQTGNYHELFQSEDFLHFRPETLKDEVFIFGDNQYLPNSERSYYHDGTNIELITNRDVTNGWIFPFLDGAVYSANDSLFYWEKETDMTLLLTIDVYRIVVDGCKLAWFSGATFNGDRKLNLYDGSKFEQIDLSSNPEEWTFKFFADDQFVFTLRNPTLDKYYGVRGIHALNNPENCNYPDSDVSNSMSYFKVRNLTSDASLDKPKTIYRATQSIRLLPGFHANGDRPFHAEIITCTPDPTYTEANSRTNEKVVNELSTSLSISPSLSQNTPNPFSYGVTNINYFIPNDSQLAILRIFNSWGQTIRQIPIKNRGEGILEIQADDFDGGIYYYTLEIDGKMMDSKKMIAIK